MKLVRFSFLSANKIWCVKLNLLREKIPSEFPVVRAVSAKINTNVIRHDFEVLALGQYWKEQQEQVFLHVEKFEFQM